MKNKGAKQKLKRKGATGAFGCDLTEYLETSGQDVPYVLRSCAEFIETHGIVDGIYRLSGVTSNIQKLRQEFGSDQCPDLTREVYLQDIHCVGSLCKLYFRELPNPLLTYELYEKFTHAVSHCPEEDQLVRIQNVIQELPPPHYRTLEYLIRHLTHIASFSSKTNMHTRNLALVWAPNLLRSKEIEAIGCNGDAAFLAVRVQQVVIEFILNHVDQIFSNSSCSMENDENRPIMKSLTLPALSLPMKLVSLEEAQARSLATNHPARKERRENSLPEIVPSTGALFHTVLELPDNKRKLSSKSKKWKSIFNLGRSGSDSKSKLNRNGSVFVRGQRLSEKATIRPAKSMDSLCSLPVEGKEAKGHFNRTVTTGGFFIPAMKLQTTSSGSSCDLSKQEGEWGPDGGPAGAEGGSLVGGKAPQARPPPEQLKVFRAVEDPENDQTSPKMLAMFYTSSDSSSKSVFTSSLFQMESSPRHQRKALNISEPFAVSVPLRVSAVISTNSTPCRTPPKEMQSLSSLEESSLQGAEGGGWPGFEEEKTSVSDTSAASAPQKLRTIKSESLEDSKPVPEKERTVECSCNHSPEPSTHPGEKEISTISASLPLSTTVEKRQDSEGATKIHESLQSELSAQQESPKDKKEDAMFLSELDEDESAGVLMWPEIQQELKIIESEEELQLPPSTAPKISSSQPTLISSPKTTVSPWTRGFSDDSSPPASTIEETTDKTIQISPPAGAVVPMTGARVDPEQISSHQRTGQSTKLSLEQSRLGDSTKAPVLEMVPLDSALQDGLVMGSSGNRLSPPPPLEQTLQKEESVTNSPEREEISEAMGTHPHSDQTQAIDGPSDPSSFYQREEVVPAQCEKQSPEEKREKLASGGEGPLRDFGAVPHGERETASLMQETFDCDEEDTSIDIAPQSLEMVEPWEDHQWVTSPLHSPTLKDVQETRTQDLLLQNQREKRFPHRPSFVQSHSLDSETTMKNQWTRPFPSSSSCVSLGSIMDFDPLQLLPPNREKGEWEKKAPRHSRELSEPEGIEDALDMNSGRDLQSKTVRTSPVSFTEEETKVDQENLQQDPLLPMNQRGSCGLGSENVRENSPSRVQDKAGPEMPLVTKGDLLPSPKLQLKNNDCVPPKGKNRPSSLNLDCVPFVNDFFRSENVISPGSQVYDQGEAKRKDPNCPWSPMGMTSPYSKADPWTVHCGPQDLDIVTHALTGRRNSAPVSVSAVRTSFMVKMCQARAVPVIPPKVQYTQIPQPLQAQSTGKDAPLPVEKAKAEASPTGGTPPPKSARDDSPPSLRRPREENTNQEGKGKENSTQMDSTSFVSDDHTLSSDPCVSCLLSSQDASVPCRKRTSETESAGDNPLSSKIERSSGVSKPFHRSRPGRPQSLILFSPPFPIMDHPSSSSDSRVLLSPIRSPTQTISSGLICGELAENTWVTPEGVTLRNKMTIPKNGQRLETSTSCFYQPQRRSVILDGRSGRQIE